jgi:hypothetical protein
MGEEMRLAGIREIPAWEKEAPGTTGRFPWTPAPTAPVAREETTWAAEA